MTITTTQLSEALQNLIDARLDTIDRMLLGRVPRADRTAIVREVEGQIYDLLQERDLESLDRDDVLAVLARLDPPEAYLPEESSSGSTPAPIPTSRRPSPTSPRSSSRVGTISGILGILALGMAFSSPLVYIVSDLLGSEILMFAGLFGMACLVFVQGALAIALAIYVRLRGVWAIVGLITGIISVLCFLAGGAFLLLEFI
jgi:hypothetical protein